MQKVLQKFLGDTRFNLINSFQDRRRFVFKEFISLTQLTRDCFQRRLNYAWSYQAWQDYIGIIIGLFWTAWGSFQNTPKYVNAIFKLRILTGLEGHYQTMHPHPLTPTHPHSSPTTPTHPKYLPTHPKQSPILPHSFPPTQNNPHSLKIIPH